MDNAGFLIIALIALVLGMVVIANDKTSERRAACEAKGGVYITGKRVSPVCVRQDSIIPMAP